MIGISASAAIGMIIIVVVVVVVVGDDRVGNCLGTREVKRLIERAPGSRRNLVEPEPERAGAIVGRIKKIFHLAGLRPAEVTLNDAATPIVGTRVA